MRDLSLAGCSYERLVMKRWMKLRREQGWRGTKLLSSFRGRGAITDQPRLKECAKPETECFETRGVCAKNKRPQVRKKSECGRFGRHCTSMSDGA